MERIAVMGLGKMGSGMAGCLLAVGHEVTVWNRTADRADDLVANGARLAATPAEAAANADIAISMVADDIASTRVWLDQDGALSTLKPGALAIECSTISHAHCQRLADATTTAAAVYLDCPVNGPPAAAASGDLILLVGADTQALERARPVLEQLSSSILHFGEVGTGTAFKLINNLLGAVHVASIAEAMNMARKLGLDTETLVAAVESGPCAGPHVKRMARPMAEGRLADTFGLAVGLREKDTRYCLAMADANGVGMAVGATAYRWYEHGRAEVGDQDDSALLTVVEKRNGTP